MSYNEEDSELDPFVAFAGVAATAVGLWAIFQGSNHPPKLANLPNNQRIEDLFNEAVWLQQSGRFAEALKKTQECLSINQNHGRAWNLVAWNYLWQNFKLEEGLQIARRAYEMASTLQEKIQFQYTVAEICFALGWIDDAIFEFRKALKLSTAQEFPQPYTLLRLGKCYQIKQDFSAAIVFLDQAKTLDPNNPDISLTLGQIYLQKCHYYTALTYYESALMLANKLDISQEVKSKVDSNCLNDIGVVYYHLKEYEKSKYIQKKAHLLSPTNPFPVINLAILYSLLDDQKQMRIYLEKLIPVIGANHQSLLLIQDLLTEPALEKDRDIVLNMLKSQNLISNEIYKQQMLLWNQNKYEGKKMNENVGSTTINIHGSVGTFVEKSTVNSIEGNILKLGNDKIAKGFEEITAQITLSASLADEQKTELLQTINALSKQAILPPQQREKGVIKGLWSGFNSSVAIGSDLASIWSTWGPKLQNYLEI